MKKVVMALIALLLVLGVAGCTTNNPKPTVKVAFIYIGDPSDGGFTYMHDQGRLAMEKNLGITATVVNSVPEDQTFETKVRELIDQGHNVIFGNSYGYGPFMDKLAKEFPDVKFLHCSGAFQSANLSNYFGKMFQPRYIAGAVTGMNIPAGGKVGYVAAFPIPEVIRMINAFALGLQSTNPTATVEVKWTNTWFDPVIEKQAGEALVAQGVDAMTIHQDTPEAILPATTQGKWGIGYHSDMSGALGEKHLLSVVWDFGPYYTAQVKAIMDGTWKSEAAWIGMDQGMVGVTKVNPNAAAGSQEKADELAKAIKEGTIKLFTGPISDNEGNLMIKEGEAYTDEQIRDMMWFVNGVIGSTK
jgi:basic membrane protein A and related proteins